MALPDGSPSTDTVLGHAAAHAVGLGPPGGLCGRPWQWTGVQTAPSRGGLAQAATAIRGRLAGAGGTKDKRAGWAPPAHPSGPLRVCALNTAECEAESPLPRARLLSSLNLSFLI